MKYIITAIGFLIICGAAGASDLNQIGFVEMVIRCAIGLVLMAAPMIWERRHA